MLIHIQIELSQTNSSTASQSIFNMYALSIFLTITSLASISLAEYHPEKRLVLVDCGLTLRMVTHLSPNHALPYCTMGVRRNTRQIGHSHDDDRCALGRILCIAKIGGQAHDAER